MQYVYVCLIGLVLENMEDLFDIPDSPSICMSVCLPCCYIDRTSSSATISPLFDSKRTQNYGSMHSFSADDNAQTAADFTDEENAHLHSSYYDYGIAFASINHPSPYLDSTSPESVSSGVHMLETAKRTANDAGYGLLNLLHKIRLVGFRHIPPDQLLQNILLANQNKGGSFGHRPSLADPSNSFSGKFYFYSNICAFH